MCTKYQCGQLKGWCKSFTALETILTIIESILLAILIVLLIFGIFHLMQCDKSRYDTATGEVTLQNVTDIIKTPYQHILDIIVPVKNVTNVSKTPDITTDNVIDSSHFPETHDLEETDFSDELDKTTSIPAENTNSTANRETTEKSGVINKINGKTKRPKPECTWVPSQKTTVITHYYDNYYPSRKLYESIAEDIHIDHPPESQGDANYDYYKGHALALVKVEHPYKTLTLGCILTIISEYWTVTAATCIESIEDVDSLDSFVMVDVDVGSNGPSHAIANVLFHPRYQGVNKTYDIAVLKSADHLNYGSKVGPVLPTLFNFMFLEMGERLNLLGFGKFRSLENGRFPRPLYKVSVFVLPSSQCRSDDTWSYRHLSRGHPVSNKPCTNDRPICAGVLYGRGTLCSYCAGTPLYKGHMLVGIMSENENCGVTCEPNNYVSVAITVDWLRSVMRL